MGLTPDGPLDRRFRIARFLHQTGLSRVAPPMPLFVRGLARSGDRLFVGVAPASILCFDLESGALVDAHQHATDVHVCVHGLQVTQSP